MKDEQKKNVQEKYKVAQQKGERFWPDSIYKDLVVSFAIFIVLILLATFLGVPSQPKADPNDTAYIPRPEWYFLFLFQMLKYFPGKLEWVGTTVVPGIAILVLLLLPIIDRNPRRHYTKRMIGLAVMGVAVVGIVGLTILAVATTPPQVEAAASGNLVQQIAQGQDLFSANCAQCHGPDGEGGVIQGVVGLDGFNMKAIHSSDEMYTRSDDTLASIIAYGQPNLGMTPFGKAYGGSLAPGDIDAIVAFMRYSWDDRVEKPSGAATIGAIPVPGPGQVPSYEANIGPLVKRYCIACHTAGKVNNNYVTTSYDEMLHSGDNAPVVTAGDEKSLMIQLITGHPSTDPKTGNTIRQMPPTKLLDQQYVNMLIEWILAGMPQTAAEAAQVTPVPIPTLTK